MAYQPLIRQQQERYGNGGGSSTGGGGGGGYHPQGDWNGHGGGGGAGGSANGGWRGGNGGGAGGGSVGHTDQEAGAGPSKAPLSSVPDLPGRPLDPHDQADLQYHVSTLCQMSNTRFPGAQPVSFEKSSIGSLLHDDYWVCEKTDGQRVLMLIVVKSVQVDEPVWPGKEPRMEWQQDVFFIDRKNNYRQIYDIYFPAPPGSTAPHANNTLMDGELVWDTEPSGKRKLRLYLFDAMVVQGENVMQKPLTKRYARLQELLYKPFVKYMLANPEAVARAPFEIKVKEMQLSYALDFVLKERIPSLKHDNDGLIFTALNSSYRSGTDPSILKWKPPSENTIDFKLRLRFPPDLTKDPSGRIPNFAAKPFFQLDQWTGRGGYGGRNAGNGRGGGRGPGSVGEDGYEYFDWMDVSDDEWEEMKASGKQYDDVIIEAAWVAGGDVHRDSRTGEEIVRPARWVMKRIRDDKENANHASILKAIIHSIQDGVEADELMEMCGEIRKSWKSPLRTEFREGRISAMELQMLQDGNYDPVIGPRRGGPGPPMREGGSLPDLIRR